MFLVVGLVCLSVAAPFLVRWWRLRQIAASWMPVVPQRSLDEAWKRERERD